MLAWLAIGAMLLKVASGRTGKFLLRRAGSRLAATTQRLRDQGLTPQALEERLYWDSLTYDTVKQWRVLHYPITLIFAVLGTAPIVSAVIFLGVVMKRWIVAIIAVNLAGIIALAFVKRDAMLAPGALMPAHQSLSNNCFTCHALLQGAVEACCKTCHAVADIGFQTIACAPISRTTRITPFHRGLAYTDCISCHNDHSMAGLTPPPSHTFAHATLRAGCANCHTPTVDVLHVTPVAQCNTCHTQTTWKAAAIDRTRFFALKGRHDAVCTSCHTTTNDFSQYTCFSCHEHQEDDLIREHLEEGIRIIDNCVSCQRDTHGEGGQGRQGSDDDD